MSYGIKVGGLRQLKKVAKPSVAGSYTFNAKTQSASVKGYDPAAMTMTGITSESKAGKYTLTFTLNKKYKWADGDKSRTFTASWTIDKLILAVPYLTNKSQAWKGTAVEPTSNNVNTTFMQVSGNPSANSVGNWSVTWSLKYPESTQFAGTSSLAVTDTWSTYAAQIAYTIRVQHESRYSQSVQYCYYGQRFIDVCPVDLSSNRSGGGSSSVAQRLTIKQLVCESRGVAIRYDWTDWNAEGHDGYLVRADLPTTTLIGDNAVYTFSPSL